MKYLKCKVAKDHKRKLIYIIRENEDGLTEGSYFLDERLNPYVFAMGYILPVLRGGQPKGELLRIYATNNTMVKVFRLREHFYEKALRCRRIQEVIITRRTKGSFRTHDSGRLSILAVNR